MCGILAVLGCSDDSQAKRVRVLELSRRLKHRGPDWSGLHQHGDCYLAHQRLAIVDPASGDQPLFNEDKSVVVTVNGEIYNHEELRKKLVNHKFRTGSDCDVIAHLYEEYGEDFVDMLDGIFSFVLLDTRDNSYIVARDAIGVTSLYIGWGLDGSVWISSEMKGLNNDCEHFECFPPGHLYSSKTGVFRRWYNPPWFSEAIPSVPYDPLVLRRAFENAVIKRLMTDVPFGVLLSGGLDSSLVASITARYLAGTKTAKHWGSQLHSFCVGLENSPDLKAAREVAEYLGTVHHEFHFTVQDGIDAIEDVIYHIETYDVTTIRASTPMFLMSRKIKSLGVKMVISGEGSDEIFGGYLYFHKAPNKDEFHHETCRKIKALHQYDCLRANKATSAWGLEARVPFLDKQFINVAMSIDPESKMVSNQFIVVLELLGSLYMLLYFMNQIKKDEGRIEKWILRRAFDDEEHPYLPKHILYRQKEQFSDGVGYSWIDGLKAHADQHVTNKMMRNASNIFPHNTPTTKEAYYYRMIFERFFPQNSARLTVPGGATVACSTAKAVEWDSAWKNNLDPSGRAALGVHLSAYNAETPLSNMPSKVIDNIPRMIEVPRVAIQS
ncbi:asparagine synthetase [glutamine-hydrolyzing] 1 isoform X1 [Gossypium hirsutum]|uniref:Asparagine synthetase [glutamine-hydrolyzing] n=1 Tax=Gossypium hirsutum TaxID=3635 RepID=A0ABM3C2W4_GOSHI|nr:asparagine synthetase [glutamine-hydrolyzing] 1-like isoform X1 [Gossypium hirsutum]